jgi:hypothetical protein
VVVHDLYIARRAVAPFKTQTPLIVDADAPLPLAISLQGFQPVLRRNPQKREVGCSVLLLQFAPSHLFNIDEARDALVLKQGLRVLASERFNHAGC